MDPADTIAAIATPPGRGGIGVVRVSGSRVPELVPALAGRTLPPRVATLATFRDGAGAIIDQGLALHFPAPQSYTGEHVVELHGHGGPAVLRLLLARCVELGARLAEPGEFTLRAFLNGKLDLAQAEGVADLIDAATTTAARAAARSLSGEFSRAIRAEVEALVELRTFTEATLDFPDEDIDFLRRADAHGRLARRARWRSRTSSARTGRVRCCATGSRSCSSAGRTSASRACSTGWPATRSRSSRRSPAPRATPCARRSSSPASRWPIVDTAGLRPTDDPIETLGIERTWAAVARRRSRAGARRRAGQRRRDHRRRCGDPRRAAARRCRASSSTTRSTSRASPRAPRRRPRARTPVQPACARLAVRARAGDGVDLLRREMLAAVGLHDDMSGRSSPASATSRRCGSAGRTSPPPPPTSRRRHRRWSSSPRSCARRRSALSRDHRRVQRRRPAWRDLLALLHRQVTARRTRRRPRPAAASVRSDQDPPAPVKAAGGTRSTC